MYIQIKDISNAAVWVSQATKDGGYTNEFKDLQVFNGRRLAVADDQALYISGWGTNINYNGGFTIEAWIDVDPSSF